ncbi:pentatricopeptide repeat-containing protein At1g01970-like [Setaria italica]|uniref:pentatricopeptide repeat-containing protein At1g01970-like n=1 Tax=Setaria italica TaxID=4555 RepID=UPI000351339D|nr:pentatricopeptide repeat-containing protein At1g01970-like [Setaria italica]
MAEANDEGRRRARPSAPEAGGELLSACSPAPASLSAAISSEFAGCAKRVSIKGGYPQLQRKYLVSLLLDKRAYGSMIMAYIRADMLDKAEELIKEMEDQQIFAGKEVYRALLRAFSYKGDSDGAHRIFDAIQFAGIVPDTKLVNAYCLPNRMAEAVCVIRNMRSARVTPCDKCIALVLGAYEKVDMLETALGFLTELEENGIAIGQEPSQLLAVWFRKLGVVHEVEQVLKELSEDMKTKQTVALLVEQRLYSTISYESGIRR